MKLSPVRITIKSYQSIAELDFEVAGFTCITGKTNIGKSAILRAVSGALLNKPVTNQVRTGAKSCSVRIASDVDGQPWGLLWEKAEKGLNRYTIDGKAERLENVGQKQPEPIAAFGFSSVRIGDKEMYPWYASQWHPLFLLDEGGPTVTQFISEISGLNVLQDAISLGLRGKRKALDELKVAEADLVQCRANLTKVKALDDLEAMAKDLDNQRQSIAEYEGRVARAKQLHQAIQKLSASVDALEPVGAVGIPRDDMTEQMAGTLAMKARLAKLEEAAKAIIALRGARSISVPEAPTSEHDAWTRVRKYAGLDRLRRSVQALEPVERMHLPQPPDGQAFGRLAAAKRYDKQISDLRRAVAKLQTVVSMPQDPGLAEQLSGVSKAKAAWREMRKLQQDIQQLELAKKQVKGDLDGVLKELAAIPSCPTCNRPVASQEHSHA